MSAFRELLRSARIVPLLAIEDPAQAVKLARALASGGLPVQELAARSPRSWQAAAAILAEVPAVTLGIGGMLHPSDVARAKKLGAGFGSSHGLLPKVAQAARKAGLAYLPGVETPSDVAGALEAGFDLHRFYPAELAGGVARLKTYATAFPQARFVPAGGVSPANARDYLALPNVLCLAGSWGTRLDAVRSGDAAALAAIAREALQSIGAA
ncbi:MAG: bifunctional 4-hydroxy-2-oxoglutarate aldolase/2-dehydro-3-deoxy-phosphogluconate aldolase [Alphaproteobacteria bacterium]|nr:bifunctional 4-hydroxy-2-oxoglutarate aldolase/2-dehydro-3-deoxy-phosphogluconate aldolase [Alphaproteobacteria bacterium]